jgi:hypothetical protein
MTAQLGQHIATDLLQYKGEKNESGLAHPIKNSRNMDQYGIRGLVFIQLLLWHR